MAVIQTLVTLIIAPGAIIFMLTVFTDILANTKHTLFGFNVRSMQFV
jgi:hypothetical protein